MKFYINRNIIRAGFVLGNLLLFDIYKKDILRELKMNKKEFVTLLRAVIRTEMKPIVKEVVQNEFRLLRESLSTQPKTRVKSREMLSEDISIDALMDESLLLRDVIEKEEAQEVEMPKARKLFKGENVFTNMLQQTIDEGYKAGSIQREAPAGSGAQNLVQIGEGPNRADMLSAIGYGGELADEQRPAGIPGTKVVQVPQMNPDGRPINPNDVPDFLLKAMNKNYSKDLKDLKKADKRRHGG